MHDRTGVTYCALGIVGLHGTGKKKIQTLLGPACSTRGLGIIRVVGGRVLLGARRRREKRTGQEPSEGHWGENSLRVIETWIYEEAGEWAMWTSEGVKVQVRAYAKVLGQERS